jgi:uroporphyrinogen decarboxylase
VTLQPVARLGVDAAILFSDILIPLEAMGIPLSFTDGEGPRLEPVRSADDVARLAVPDPEERTRFVMDAIRLCRKSLAGEVPLIGFAGAPWTLLSYAVEGKTSKAFADSKRLLFAAPAVAHALLEKITQATILYLQAQVRAGAEVVQLFDSWAGALAPEDYRAFALPYVQRIVAAVRTQAVPFIYFCNEGATLLADAATVGADVIGVDFRVPLDQAREKIAGRAGVQGNLDPCALFGAPELIERRAADVLARAGDRHVFNLGHGILPPTPVEHAQALVECVHRLSVRSTPAA